MTKTAWITLMACAAFLGGTVSGYALALRDVWCLMNELHTDKDPQACEVRGAETPAAVVLGLANIDRMKP